MHRIDTDRLVFHPVGIKAERRIHRVLAFSTAALKNQNISG